MRRWLVPFAAIALLVGLPPAVRPLTAGACFCDALPSPLTEFEGSDAVFAGYLVMVEPLPAWGEIWTFETSQVWKGPVAETLYVVTGPPCGYPFEEKRTYIVYAGVRNDTYRVWLCSRTTYLLHASEDLQALGEGSTPEPGTVGPYPWTGEIAAAREAPERDADAAGPVEEAEPAPTTAVASSESASDGESTLPAWAIALIVAAAACLAGGAGFATISRRRARRT